MKIGSKTIETITTDIQGLLNAYQNDLDKAYLAAGDDPLKISLGVKVSPKDGKLKIETSISFTTEKIKDTKTSLVDEQQGSLFENASAPSEDSTLEGGAVEGQADA